MNKIHLLLFSFLLWSASTLIAQEKTLIHDGLEREYFVHVPSNYVEGDNWPLVINMHGYGSNKAEQMLYSQFNPIANANNFIVVYPQGLLDATGTPHFNAYFSVSSIDDVGFINQLIDQLYTDYNVDLSRVYSTGMSNGGFMSYRLACELPERIAAIASVTGSMLQVQVDNCVPARPMPVMQIHGTADGTVPFAYPANLGGVGEGIPDVVDYWVQNNGCGTSDTTAIEDINMLDNSTASLIKWESCDATTEVQFYIIENGGHSWPGAFPVPTLGNTNQDFAATPAIWEFLSRFQHPNPADGTLVGTEQFAATQAIRISPNPFQDFIEIEGEVQTVQLYNQIGQLLQTNQFNKSNAYINTDGLAAGVYLLAVETEEGKRVYKVVK